MRWWRLRPVVAQEGYAGHASSSAFVAAPRVAEGEAWWSQAGSNRRPRHCERRALPAELWPHRGRLMGSGRPVIGAIYNPRQGQVKNGEIADFPGHLPGTSLVWEGGNRYL